jgi:hypothetical protein
LSGESNLTTHDGTNTDEILKELYHRSIKETLEALPYITQVFRNKEYDLDKIITNELDFLLGAVLSQIINTYSCYCMNRGIKPTREQSIAFNVSLFSKASEYRDAIKEITGL